MYVTALEECSRDNLEFIKERSLRALSELLRRKPEGEAALLTGLVNKLGDPSRKLASKVRAQGLGYRAAETLNCVGLRAAFLVRCSSFESSSR